MARAIPMSSPMVAYEDGRKQWTGWRQPSALKSGRACWTMPAASATAKCRRGKG